MSGTELVYGKRPVAEAQRGRRRVRRVWRAPETDSAELTRLAGSPDHQGVVAEVDPYPYADATALLEKPDALIVALDRIQDPQNLGAIARSAEAAGAAGVTAATAKASAGAVEHLPIARANLADFLSRAKEAGAWVYGAAWRSAATRWFRSPSAAGLRR